MPSSSDEKSTRTLPENAPRSTRPKPKTTQGQATKTAAPGSKESVKESNVATPEARERKTSAKQQPSTKESKSAGPRADNRPRKLTPQQQIHLARARRRRRNERMGIGLAALAVIVVISVVAWQIIAKNEASTRLANAHAAATSTALVHATATQAALNVLEPQTPPTVTGKTIKLKDGLEYIDIKVGTGQAAKEGDTISVRYVGWNTPSNCEVVDVCQFDSSYYENIQNNTNPMTPTQFQLVPPDQDGVIQGWVEGITGMKPGGERRLIIPPSLAYGSQPPSGGGEQTIPANATLIFDVTLVSIDTPTPTPTASS